MKYAFSTLACPGWTWDELCATAKDCGFDGIEVRGVGDWAHTPETVPFNPEHLQETAARLAHLHLQIPCFSTDCLINDRARNERHLRVAHAYIDTAERLASASGETPYVRVLADTAPHREADVDIPAVARDLHALSAYAHERGVTLLTETNGVFAETDAMLALLEQADHPNLAVLWDIHHTFRFGGESPASTYQRLQPYIKHVHVKDSRLENGKVCYQMLGAGDVPVAEALAALSGSFDGFVSLEWVKRWCPELAEPGIVLPLFIDYVRRVAV